jgi:hypothetical protein
MNLININDSLEDMVLHTPKPVQGGNTYISSISNNNEPFIFQTPRCKSKKGMHYTNKQIYTDLLFNDHDYNFLNWVKKLETRIRKLIYDKRDTWFGGDEDDELALEDIEMNWMESIKTYKKKYLIRTFFPKNIKSYTRSVSVYDDDENELTVDSIKQGSDMITILELTGLRFSPTYFNLELNVRQVMVLKEKEIFSKCLIKRNNSNKRVSVEDKNYKKNEEDTDYEDESIIGEESQDDEEEENEVKEKINVVKKNDEDEEDLNREEINNTLVKNKGNQEISEINIEIPKETANVSLKKPNEVYLEIYKKARTKAKEAKMEAIKAYLTLKEIKKQYLLDEIDLSEDESDDEQFLFSEK